MRRKTSSDVTDQRLKPALGEGANWALVIGGALLSTLSVRLGFKLKQALKGKQQNSASLKGNERSADKRSLKHCRSRSSFHSFGLDDNGCSNCASGEGEVYIQHPPDGRSLAKADVSLPLVTVHGPEYGMAWVSSPERCDPPLQPFHQSSNPDSPSISESGSDLFSKREVIHKLRQQLKRRDDMILEMQDQITELQNAFSTQMSRSNHLQSQLDSASREFNESQREIQRLRKVISDHCMVNGKTNEKQSPTGSWVSEGRNGHMNGSLNGNGLLEFPDKGIEDERFAMLKKEVGELKEVIEGKEFLLQSYKEQKVELSTKMKELQQRLDYQLPHIL